MDSALENGHRRDHSTSYYTTYYAWASFIVWTIVIFGLLFGIAFFAFVRSNLPDVKVHRLDIYKLNVTGPRNKNKDTGLTIDVQISVNVTNNKKMTLVYEFINVETMIEGFSLPKVRLDEFRQKAMTAHYLKIHPQEMTLAMNDDDAKELKLSADNDELAFNLKMKGKIQFWYKGRVMRDLHLKVDCEGIEQSQVDQAQAHECNVKLGFFS